MDYLATEITRVERLVPGYVLLRFSSERPIRGVPGQFAMVRGDWGSDPILPRAFSLIEVGEEGAILVRVVGPGTSKLAAMRAGDRLFVLGPRGRGFRPPDPKRLPVLVAGGVGVAPLVFLAEQQESLGRCPLFFYGARTAADLPLVERVASLSDLTVTTDDGSRGEQGLVTAPLERAFERPDIEVFACGPEPMIQAVALSCRTAGVPCQVALESPMACGMGTCRGCAVLATDGSYRYVCSDGPVFDATDVYGPGDLAGGDQ